MTDRTFTVEVSRHDGMFWGEVVELPGVFASAETWDELAEAVAEAVGMALDVDLADSYAFSASSPAPELRPTKAELSFA